METCATPTGCRSGSSREEACCPSARRAAQALDKKFYVTVLALPVIGVFIFQILPVLFMILIAFTNYGGRHCTPELVDWVGLANFKNC